MKTFNILTVGIVLLLNTFNAFAGMPYDAEATSDAFPLSTVEKIIPLQAETNKEPRINLVVVDNGGSTDIGSRIAPSSLYLVFHQDGEVFNVDVTYPVLTSIVEVITASYDKNEKKISLEVLQNDGPARTEKNKKVSVTIFIADIAKELENPQGNDQGVFAAKSTIGVQVSEATVAK